MPLPPAPQSIDGSGEVIKKLTPQNIQLDMSAYSHHGLCRVSLPRAGLLPHCTGQEGNNSQVQIKLEGYLGCLAQG